MKAQTVTIIGLDRLGGSMALALQASDLDLHILGYDDDKEVRQQAEDAGIVHETQSSLYRAAAAGDIVVLSRPLSKMKETLTAIGQDVKSHALVLDMSRLKMPAQKLADKYLQQGHFVGIAPVLSTSALTENDFSLQSARATLFQNSLLCVIPSATANTQAVESTVNLGTRIGAKPYFIDLMEYDALSVVMDTLPSLLAASLFGAANQSTGWRDILRFAGPHFALATLPLQEENNIAHMALANKTATLHWIRSIIEQLQLLSGRIQEGDRDTLAAYFTDLGIERDRWLHLRTKNDWDERMDTNISSISLVDRLIGRAPKSKDE